jgi:hypothetical protein
MTTDFIREKQNKQLDRFAQDIFNRALKEIPFDRMSRQRLLAYSDQVKKDIISLFTKYSVTDDRFKLLTSFPMTVPEDYDHDKQLINFLFYIRRVFVGKFLPKHLFVNEDITDANFKASQRLIPGKTYLIEFFEINGKILSEDCLAFYAARQVIFAGAQGLSLVYLVKKDMFPEGKWIISFDKKNALWPGANGQYMVPYIHSFPGIDFRFALSNFDSICSKGDCLLCINE